MLNLITRLGDEIFIAGCLVKIERDGESATRVKVTICGDGKVLRGKVIDRELDARGYVSEAMTMQGKLAVILRERLDRFKK